MRERDWRIRVRDILQAVERISRYTEGMKFEDFRDDDKTVDAVIRNLTVIGEASRNIPDAVQKQYPNVPWREMQGMRNVVVHEYFGVSLPILWRTVTDNLPPMRPLLASILETAEHE